MLVVQYVEQVENADLTQTLLQLRSRRRSRTATARRQTDRLVGRTYADVAARVNPNETFNNAASATNTTADTADSADRTRANGNAAG